MNGGTIYDGRHPTTGGRPPTTEPDPGKTRRDLQLAAALLGGAFAAGICCGLGLFGTAIRLIHL